jgi:hypothetical protein
MFIPDPGSKRSRIRPASKNLVFLTQKIVFKLSEICSGMFIPDPDLDFSLPGSQIQGVKKALDCESRIQISNTVK